MLVNSISELYSYRELMVAWTLRTIKARYQQSVLGGLWAVIQPASSVVIFSVIFTFFVPVSTNGVPYILFSYTAMVPWTLFSSSVMDMVESLVGNMNLVGKIYFPRVIFPLAALLARLFDALIASLVLIILMIYFHTPVFIQGWLLVPFILLIQLALALGLGLAGAAFNVFYRDARHLYNLALQVWLYASPIIYPASSVPEKYRSFYYLNPMAGTLEAYRAVLLYQKLPDYYLLISALTSIIILLVGYLLFKRFEPQFADVV